MLGRSIAMLLLSLSIFSSCTEEEQLTALIIPTKVSFSSTTVSIGKSMVQAVPIGLVLARPLEKPGSITIQRVAAETTAANNEFSTNLAFTGETLTIDLPLGTSTVAFSLTSKHNFDADKTVAFKIIAATGGAILNETNTSVIVTLRGDLYIDPAMSVSLASLPDFGNVTVNTLSTAKSYTLTGANLTNVPITIAASANFKVSLNNVDFVSSITNTFTATTTSATVYVKFNPATTVNQNLTGTITHTAAGLANIVVNVSGVETGNIPYVAEVPILNENFNYGASTDFLARLSTDWLAYSAPGSIPVTYLPQGLSFTRYAGSGVGGSVTIDHGDFSREDVAKTFASKTTGIIYTSVLVNLSKAGDGDFFFATRDAGGSFFNRLYAKDGGNGTLSLGLGKNATVGYATSNYKYNTTYLIVTKYDFTTKISSMYVFDGTFPDVEPTTPTVVSLATGTSPANLTDVSIRQSDGVLSAGIDGIRIATTWRGVLGY